MSNDRTTLNLDLPAGTRIYGKTADPKGISLFKVVREYPKLHEDEDPDIYKKSAPRWRFEDYAEDEEWEKVDDSSHLYFHLLSEESAGRCKLINDPHKADAPTAEEIG